MNTKIKMMISGMHGFPVALGLAGWLVLASMSATQTSAAEGAATVASLNAQLLQFTNNPAAIPGISSIVDGIALAKRRRSEFKRLIQSNPQAAVALAVTGGARGQFPAGIAGELETNVSGLGDYVVLGAVDAGPGTTVEAIQQYVYLNGQKYRAYVYGRRLGQTTKHGIPLHGVAVDGVMAVQEQGIRELGMGEAPDQGSKVSDLRSAAEIASGGVVYGESGGKVYMFGSHSALAQAEARLEAAEAGIGPTPKATAAGILTPTGSTESIPAPTEAGSPQPDPPTPWTTGLKRVLVIRVDFPDLQGDPQWGYGGANPPVYTQSYCKNFADASIIPYYQQSSYGQTSLTNTVSAAVYRMPQASTYYATNSNNDQLHTDAQNAASADFTLVNFDRIIVLFSALGSIPGSGINYGGLADVGGTRVWVNGDFNFRVVAHELGHTYGLYHANLWQVSDGNPISPSGVDTEYGDIFDTMSANYANSTNTDFNPWFKNTLGWVTDNQILTVTTNGTYRINRFDNWTGTGTLALKVVKDTTYNYWIACKRKYIENAAVTSGAYVFWGYNFNRQSDLLDMTTPGTDVTDAPLALGAVFNDTNAFITIHPVDDGGTSPNEYMDVQIVFGTPPAVAPTISTEPANQTVPLGGVGSFITAAVGSPAASYQWQRLPAGGGSWINLTDGGGYSGSTSNTLIVTALDVVQSGDLFQCIATNSAGSATSSPPAMITVTSGLEVSTLAGVAGNGGTGDGTGSGASFFYPWGIATDKGGIIYVTEYYDGSLRRITPAGVVTKLAPSFSFAGPEAVAIDATTNIFVADTGDQKIRKVSLAGAITAIAGSGSVGTNDGPNTTAQFNNPGGIAVDDNTNIFVADTGTNTIRKIVFSGAGSQWVVTTIAGLPGVGGSADGTNSAARFNQPNGIAVDAAHNIYVADSDNDTIRKITVDGTGTNWAVTTFAGRAGHSGNKDGVGTNAMFYNPQGLSVDAGGNVYVADQYNNLIRKITPTGVVSTLAGLQFADGTADGYFTNAQFSGPEGVAVDGNANIYITDTYNYTIRVGHLALAVTPTLKITPAGQAVTLAWSQGTANYVLQSNTSLTTPAWTTVGNTPLFVNSHGFVTNNLSSGQVFYRMLQQ